MAKVSLPGHLLKEGGRLILIIYGAFVDVNERQLFSEGTAAPSPWIPDQVRDGEKEEPCYLPHEKSPGKKCLRVSSKTNRIIPAPMIMPHSLSPMGAVWKAVWRKGT